MEAEESGKDEVIDRQRLKGLNALLAKQLSLGSLNFRRNRYLFLQCPRSQLRQQNYTKAN